MSHELLLRIHSAEMIRAVGRDPLCATAWHSAGGIVEAVRAVGEGGPRSLIRALLRHFTWTRVA